MLKLSDFLLAGVCGLLWACTVGYLAHVATTPAPSAWLIDEEAAPLAAFKTLAACESDRAALGITSDEYFCAEVQ